MFSQKRARMLRQAEDHQFDLAVIGGGITGAGVAREATLAGMQAIVLDKGDFGGGTSSRSTKIFHGGLRYLEHLELGLVRDSGRERERMTHLGGHLVHPLPMVLPVYHNSRYGLRTMSMAVWLYDWLARVNPEDKRHVLSTRALLRREPLLSSEGLVGGILYHEYQTDDARTTLTVMRAAIRGGAMAINYARIVDFIYEQGRITGVVAEDQEDPSHPRYRIRSQFVVNAAGPWAEDVLRRDQTAEVNQILQHSRGIHIVVPLSRLPLQHAWSIPTVDGRLVFVIPRGEAVYLGTTDTAYRGDFDHPPIPEEEVQYLLSVVNTHFPMAGLTPTDIIGQWSGVRPLIRQPGRHGTQDISRRDQIWVAPSGLITVAGGKLTAWRKMGEDVMRVLYREAAKKPLGVRLLPFSQYRRQSCTVPLPGNPMGQDSLAWVTEEAERIASHFRIGEADAMTLVSRYGTEAGQVLDRGGAEGAKRLIPGLPLFQGELPYFLTEEMAVHLADIIVRRTGFGWFHAPKARRGLVTLGTLVGQWAQWDPARIDREIEQCAQEAYWTERGLGTLWDMVGTQSKSG